MKRRDMLDEEDDVAWGGGTQRMEQDVFEEKTSKEASIVAKVKKSKIRLKRKSSSSACVASSSEFESSGGKSSNEGNPVTEASSDEWAFLGSLSADDVAFSSALNSPPPGKSSSRISQSGREVRKALVISYSEETQVDESRHKDHSLLDVTLMSSADETRPLDHLNVKEAAEAGVFPVAAPPSSYSSSSSSFPGLQLCLRFVAIDVSDDTMQRRKDIRCLSTQSDMVYSSQEGGSHQDSLHHVFVSGHWYDVSISGGDVFHVILLNELSFHNASYGGIMMHKEQAIIVDDTTNLLICFPDLLLSPSKIIDSLLCSRKSLLSSRFPGSLPSSAAVLGSLKHEFIEKVIQQVWRKLGDRGKGKSGSGAGSLVTSEQIGCFIETATHNLRKDLVACGIDQSTAKPELEGVLDNVIDWSRRAFYNMPGEGGTSTYLALKEVIGVEETFTLTVLGMKGAVDLVVAGRRKSEEVKSQGNTALEMFPLEIKTGVRKPIALIGHRAQVILYVLALRIRHLSSGGVSINTHLSPSSGILLYVHSEKTESELVTPSWTDIRQLMIARNALAMYTTVVESHGHSLPPMLMSPGDCARCFQASECMVVHKAIEGGSPTSSGASDLFEYSTKHLSDAHLDYFHHWLRLVDMEAGAMDSKFSPWAQSGHQREQKGENCMSGWSAIMINEVDSSEGSFCMILTRQLPPSQSPRSSVDPLRLAVDDRVLLSAEVQRSTTRDIEDTTCLSDKAFSVVDVEACLAVGRVGSITSVRAEILLSKMSSRLQSIAANGFLLRLDKEESGYSVGSMRTNLRRLVSSPFVPGNFNSASMKKLSPMIQSDKMDSRTSTGDENLRLMIIDFRAPFFVSVYENGMEMFCPRSVTLAFFQSAAPGMEVHRNSSQIQNIGGLLIYPGCNPLVLYEEFLRLNSDQKNAVKRLLSAEHYVLILGAPGTGKTSVLSLIVRALIAKGCKVLISSHTNTAVDNLLAKIIEKGVPPSIACRLGSPLSVHPTSLPYLLNSLDEYLPSKSVDTLAARCRAMRLVCATVQMSSTHPLLNTAIQFDWSIVDEAGQVSQPAILGPLLLSSKFCLVGDHYQLPPLVNSAEALNKGMDVSLFRRLAEHHPQAISALTYQYRMNEGILLVCNTLIYSHRLRCANAEVAHAKFQLPSAFPITLNDDFNAKKWLWPCLHPSRSVILLNTDSLDKACLMDSNLLFNSLPTDIRPMVNAYESMTILNLVWTLSKTGYDLRNLAILSPYRSQVAAIIKDLHHLEDGMQRRIDCEVSTVDRFQGRDAEIVIVSTVRSNNNDSAGELLRDWRRINVAVTRSKHKLVVIGSAQLMLKTSVLKSFVSLAERRNWIVDFPEIDPFLSLAAMMS